MAEPAHRVHALAPNIAGKHWPEPVPPEPHGLVTHVDAALEQQILDVAQRQWEPDVYQHDQPDDLGR